MTDALAPPAVARQARGREAGVLSSITHLLVAVDHADAAAVEGLSIWIAQMAPRRDDRATGAVGALLPLTDPIGSEVWGGYKAPSVQLWAGVLNGIDLAAFLDQVAKVPWEYPAGVQILLRDEEDPWFFLYMLRGGELRQYAPLSVDDGLDDDEPWGDEPDDGIEEL